MERHTALDEMKERDAALKKAMSRMTEAQKYHLERNLQHIRKRQLMERMRGTLPSAREMFEMRNQSDKVTHE